ncbi:MAG: PstS family phosphate ABC transporter substrate-binding protein [Cyclobacteriaceae bacterium]
MKWILLVSVLFFFSCQQDDATIKLKGSDTEVNLSAQLAESFHHQNDTLLISVSGGGSGLGIASLLNGTTDIANSSRSINADELSLFKKKSIELDSFVFARDAIAFVVSDKLPLDSLSTADLAKILNGTYTNWSRILNINIPINVYGRQSNSGTHDFIKSVLRIRFSPDAKQMNGNAQILEAIKADASGIGYVGAGYVMQGARNGIKVLKICIEKSRAISPLDTTQIASGNYIFQRPLFQYYRRRQYQKVKPFLDFEKSPLGAAIIHSSGYYPANKLP